MHSRNYFMSTCSCFWFRKAPHHTSTTGFLWGLVFSHRFFPSPSFQWSVTKHWFLQVMKDLIWGLIYKVNHQPQELIYRELKGLFKLHCDLCRRCHTSVTGHSCDAVHSELINYKSLEFICELLMNWMSCFSYVFTLFLKKHIFCPVMIMTHHVIRADRDPPEIHLCHINLKPIQYNTKQPYSGFGY